MCVFVCVDTAMMHIQHGQYTDAIMNSKHTNLIFLGSIREMAFGDDHDDDALFFFRFASFFSCV